MADLEDEDPDAPAPPPPPELTPEEKIQSYKDALADGHMGAKEFHEEYQRVWLQYKADKWAEIHGGAPGENRRSRGSIINLDDA